MDYSYVISEKSTARKPSPLRALFPISRLPGMISLGAGNPNPETFPFSSMKVTLKDGKEINIEGADMDEALQYGPTPGFPPLVSWLRDLQLREHSPSYEEFEISIGTGSQDLLTKAIEMLIEPDDNVLIESPAYTGALAFFRSQPCKLIEIETDAQGMIPESLSSVLENWDATLRVPKFLYTVPVGSNPTGSSISINRKLAVYRIAQKHNLLIIEDDPYYYLQFNSPRIPSYLSMDVDRRVLRFDSMSKILSAGLRIGWVTGPAPLVERINLHTQATNLQASGVAQAITYALLKHWGIEGYYAHADKVAALYREKRDCFLRCAERHLNGVAEWNTPDAGMFVWIKLNTVQNASELIIKQAVEKKVLAVPGEVFLPNPYPSPFVRVSYSNVTEEQMDEALKRLASLLKQ